MLQLQRPLLVFTTSDDESPVRLQHCSTNASSPACRSEVFHHQSIITSTITAHLHKINIRAVLSKMLVVLHRTMTHLPLRKTSQQHHWMMKSGLKIQFQNRQLCIHETPHEPKSPVFLPLSIQHHILQNRLNTILHHRMKQCFHNEQMDFSDISSDLPDIMVTIPVMVTFLTLRIFPDSAHLDNIQHRVMVVHIWLTPKINNAQDCVYITGYHDDECIYYQNQTFVGYSVHYSSNSRK